MSIKQEENQEDIDTQWSEYQFTLPVVIDLTNEAPETEILEISEDNDQTQELPQQPQPEPPIDEIISIDDSEQSLSARSVDYPEPTGPSAFDEDEELYRLATGNRIEYAYEVSHENIEQVVGQLIWDLTRIPHNHNDPIFLLVRMRDQRNRRYRTFAMKFNPENLNLISDMVQYPWKAWEFYNQYDGDMDSDVPHNLQLDEDMPEDPEAGVWQVEDLGLFRGSWYVEYSNEDFQRFWNEVQVYQNEGYHEGRGRHRRRRVGRFMQYTINYDKTLESNSAIARFWRNIDIQCDVDKWFQIPWFIVDEALLEPDEGNLACIDPIFSIPCFLYAIKNQIPEEVYNKVKNLEEIHGYGVKTTIFTKLYNEYSIGIRIKSVYYEGPNFHIQTKVSPRKEKDDNPVKYWCNIIFWEDHYMQDKSFVVDGVEMNFCRILELSKQEGLIYPLNSWDYVKLYDNYSFDEMIHFNDKLYIKNTPDNYEYKEDNWNYLEYKEKKYIKDVWFADFEASTDQKYHEPYLIVARGFKIQLVKGSFKYTPIDDYKKFWGPDCAEKFLTMLCNRYGKPTKCFAKLKTACRVYFHNLRYDFTFLYPFLFNMEQVNKGNILYSVKGIYKHYGFKVKIDFWDSFPIFQTSLKVAANTYLTPEQKTRIKKEIYPYNIYTRAFFDLYWTGYCPFDVFLSNIKENDKEEFLKTIEQNKTRFIKEDKINYKEYAIFYCEQDVNCLTYIMQNFADLLLGKNIEGVNGVPPISLNLWNYRTASSIGYEYFMKTVMLKKEGENFIPRYNWRIPKCALRAIIQKSIRGGRVMVRDNDMFHVKVSMENLIQDFDFVSLYPAAMKLLWITEGPPVFIKKDIAEPNYDRDYFLKLFMAPEELNVPNKFSDGIIHLVKINTKLDLHFPLLCIKDKKTKLNNYTNYFHAEVDTWVNAIDIYNVIDFQRADIEWDAAIAWKGERKIEIRENIEKLFEFRANNKKHPIQLIAKLMLNSIFGKSILKPSSRKKVIVDRTGWRYDKNLKKYIQVDTWSEFYHANAYRIVKFEPRPGDKIEVELYKRDVSSSLNIFGSDVLAMARRLIGRLMSLAEAIESFQPELSPGIFYTDTDSMHITTKLLKILEKVFEKNYGFPLNGTKLGQCHEDFDAPKNFKPGEKVLGAIESYFIAKKCYADKLVGDQGSIGYHMRMKGIPLELVKFEDYEKIYKGEEVEFDLLENHVRFYYKDGFVGSREEFKRKIMSKETRENKKHKK